MSRAIESPLTKGTEVKGGNIILSETILSTDRLTKTYGGRPVLDSVSMNVQKGDIYGFVGLNGAGKTTMIRLISGLICKTSGGFTLFGVPDTGNMVASRKRISCMVENPALYANMTAIENLKMQYYIRNDSRIEKAENLLRLVGLENTGKAKVKNFSLGMRQRLAIAMALVGSPEFLLLDEPTNGLDPEGIREVRELLQRLNREREITILISSHILTELEKLATTYGFIHRGKLVKEISSSEIEKAKHPVYEIDVSDTLSAMRVIGEGVEIVSPERILVRGEYTATELVHILDGANILVKNISTASTDLESYFMTLIGGKKE